MTKQHCLPVNTKFRVIMNQVCFYTTKKKILNGIGDLISCNDAIQITLCAFEGLYFTEIKSSGQKLAGYCGSCRGYEIQLTMCE